MGATRHDAPHCGAMPGEKSRAALLAGRCGEESIRHMALAGRAVSRLLWLRQSAEMPTACGSARAMVSTECLRAAGRRLVRVGESGKLFLSPDRCIFPACLGQEIWPGIP